MGDKLGAATPGNGAPPSPPSPASPAPASACRLPPAAAAHVRAWARSRHARVFRLSSRAVQLCFDDASELLLLPDGRTALLQRPGAAPGAAAERFDLLALPPAEVAPGGALLRRLRYARALLERLAAGGPAAAAEDDSLEL
jgi:hypothetical protein